MTEEHPAQALGRPGASPPVDSSLGALPAPAALFDDSLRLLGANEAFLGLCRPPHEAGRALVELLPPAGAPPSLPASGAAADYRAWGAGGQPIALTLARQGDRVGALARPVVADGAPTPARTGGEALGPAQTALLALSRELALASGEDELVACIVRGMQAVFPGRSYCVRIVDPRSLGLTSLYAEGQLMEDARERLAMRRSAALKAHLDVGALAQDRVQLTEAQPLVFTGSARGFATPLVANGQLFGILNLEYPRGFDGEVDRDEQLLIQFANQAAVGVRNAKLIEEITFVKKYFEDLVESANALILVVGGDLRIRTVNRALSALTGVSCEEAVGQPIDALLPKGDPDGVRQLLRRTLRGEKVTGFSARLKRAGGVEARAILSTAPLMLPSGDVEGAIATGQDVTQQKELERRVLQADKLASLGQLATGVVHEINNPLTTITLYAEVLLHKIDGAADPASHEKLAKIKESAERILRFARDLTSYARPAQDRPELVDLHAALDQAVSYCEHAFKKARAVVERDFDRNLQAVRGVRANLVQVFVNLLTNAAHALPAEGGAVGVATRSLPDGVEIAVSDSGCGIDEGHLPHIFDPFYTTKPEGHGTGLGLPIVQGIVAKHGGQVRVETAMGRGTTFTIFLPTDGIERPR